MARYDYYNEYIEENPTVEDTETLISLDLLNYYLDKGKYSKILEPQQYSYEGADSTSVSDLITNLQGIGGNPYIFMGGIGEASIGTYLQGEEGYRAQFGEDEFQYINKKTGEKLTRFDFTHIEDEKKWLDYLKEKDSDPKYKKWLDENAYKEDPNIINFDDIRPMTNEEKTDTLFINSPLTERLKYKDKQHPLDSYTAELAHAYQFGFADQDYRDYLNIRSSKEHDRFGDSGKYKNSFTVENEAHSSIEPALWNHITELMLGQSSDFEMTPQSYKYYQQGLEGPENYVRILNE